MRLGPLPLGHTYFERALMSQIKIILHYNKILLL